MDLLLRTTFLLRLGDVMRIDACERHSEYSRVVHGLVAPRSLALWFGARLAPACAASIRPACNSEDRPFHLQNGARPRRSRFTRASPGRTRLTPPRSIGTTSR